MDLSDRILGEMSWVKIHETDLGNAGSLRYALDLAVKEESGKFVYFAEDDYLYRPGAFKILMEGAAIADYVTLYDHPDKYTNQYNYGEISKVRKTASTHWRYTLSTCMTFGVWADTLKWDMRFWHEQTESDCPNDHQVFADLNGGGRRLAVSIPGWACHTDLTYSGVVNHLFMEPWAIDQMVQKLDEDAKKIQDFGFHQLREAVMTANHQPWQRLQMLDALVKMKAG